MTAATAGRDGSFTDDQRNRDGRRRQQLTSRSQLLPTASVRTPFVVDELPSTPGLASVAVRRDHVERVWGAITTLSCFRRRPSRPRWACVRCHHHPELLPSSSVTTTLSVSKLPSPPRVADVTATLSVSELLPSASVATMLPSRQLNDVQQDGEGRRRKQLGDVTLAQRRSGDPGECRRRQLRIVSTVRHLSAQWWWRPRAATSCGGGRQLRVISAAHRRSVWSWRQVGVVTSVDGRLAWSFRTPTAATRVRDGRSPTQNVVVTDTYDRQRCCVGGPPKQLRVVTVVQRTHLRHRHTNSESLVAICCFVLKWRQLKNERCQHRG